MKEKVLGNQLQWIMITHVIICYRENDLGCDLETCDIIYTLKSTSFCLSP